MRDRSAVQRTGTTAPAYAVDLTLDSDSDAEVVPLGSSNRHNKRKRSPTPDEAGSESDGSAPELGDEEYEIDYIVDSRFRAYRGKATLEYLIHWKGYGVKDRTWTLADQLDDDDPPVLDFYRRCPGKPRKTQRTLLDVLGKRPPNAKKAEVKPRPPKRTAQPTPKRANNDNRLERDDRSDKENYRTSSKSLRVESDDDFVMSEGVSEDAASLHSDPEEPESSVASADEVDDEPKQPAKKMNGGWGNRIKGVKKAAVNLGHFKTGVLPLEIKADGKGLAKNMSEDLPPISDIEAMFAHLSSRLPAIAKVAERLNGRKLRVATMCSGTESPLLALGMIARAVKEQYDVSLLFEHVFSCEIEPFKQAYIERNFAPPILFRDVTELGRSKAHTAYGSLVKVPGNVDMLIAGTSCVDYSGLNNEKQDIDANGESGRTFRGMLQWVNKHRPPIVILENVCSAPWDKVVEYFAEIDYDAQYQRLDTKEYYIPHTRTRVYLFATPMDKDTSHLPEKWATTVRDLRRPWSSPFEAFLLPADDTNIHRARLDLAAAKFYRDGTQRKATDWGRCESRHARARQEEALGILRPLTSWQEAGVCKGLDWTWNDWLLSQTERVLDLLEISTLRMAKDGIDAGYKACIWNVSQNVDRQTGSSKTALAPCLTPNMIPWVTNRGGPVTGREALALQGIPVRELLLTSESEDQLADLAGNAMTSTVVGATMLAALHLAVSKLPSGASDNSEPDEMDAAAANIVCEHDLHEQALDLAKVDSADLVQILHAAQRSSRHCECEGQSGTASSAVDECTACGYRSCKACGGRPEHVYATCNTKRMEPAEFERTFKDLLPMRVTIAGLTQQSLSAAREAAKGSGKGSVKSSDWDLWSNAVLDAVDNVEFRFRFLKRQQTWTAVYEAPFATLDLCFKSPTPEWRLTVKAPTSEPVKSRLRELVLHPVARMRLNVQGNNVLSGKWEVCIPSAQTFDIEIAGCGELVPTWQAALGLQGTLEGKTRWSQIRVTVPSAADRALDRELSGVYSLLPLCGQAQSSLHIQESKDTTQPPLFLFLDPTRCGDASKDHFVFSTSTERLDYYTERDTIASLSNKWRESSKPKETVTLNTRGSWTICRTVRLAAVSGQALAVGDSPAHCDEATYAIPTSPEAISLATRDCTQAPAILSVRVPLDAAHSEDMWQKGSWGEVDLQHHGNGTFANLAWVTERLPLLDGFSSWNRLNVTETAGAACDHCAPLPPTIHWIKQPGKLNKNGGKTKSTIMPFEDRLEAGRYEHALKNRPAPFVLQLRLDDDIGSFRIGLNATSLAHRALARLPKNDSKGRVQMSWRLTPGQVVDVPEPPRVFVLPSNKRDPEAATPKDFLLPLRREQRRSLSWMLSQERAEGKSHTFVEEEISEALLPSLGWRAEGKAERPVMVRGGVIADQVGYGKTIISLALIAETKGQTAPESAPPGLIDLKATLLVVPGHLSKQWPSEIERFTGNLFNTIVIQNMKDLQKRSIADLTKADIIVVASEVFDSESYWERFEYLSAQPEDWLNDKQGGRFFADRLDTAMTTLRSQTESLQTEGGAAAQQVMDTHHKRAIRDAESKTQELNAANFGKRLKGAAYRDKYDDSQPPSKKLKAGGSRWAADDEEDDPQVAVPKLAFRRAAGTDSLTSPAVGKNYKLLGTPVLHMFRFRRVIADEFTYLSQRPLASLLRLSSCYKWVLSGTPPVEDFPAIRSIATFMGIHLGVEDDTEGSTASQKARAKEQTAAERFHAFREIHSAAWHRRRHDLAQEFLDGFVRQNIAEIEDIPTVEHIHEIKLPASEGAVYLELEHHLQALEMQARKETKFKNVTQGDRNARLEEALTDSKTAEEALLKRCCHFTLDLTDKKRDAASALEACQHIASARRSQLEGCEDDLRRTINNAVGLNALVRKKGGFKAKDERQHFREWVDFCFDTSQHHGDAEAAKRLVNVLVKCNFRSGAIPDAPADGKLPKTDAKSGAEDLKWELREQAHLLRRLSKELVARVRSLRFFEVVRKLQHSGDERVSVLEGSECGHRPSTNRGIEMAVLSCCGHVSCHQCMVEAVNNQRCVNGDDCHAPVRHTNIVKVSTLGIEGELESGRFGAKLQRLVDLIDSIPRRERILVFVQWANLFGKVSEAMKDAGINHATLTGSVAKRANTLDKFQSTDADGTRVLLLNTVDASASGSNLTMANHAIFLGPLFTPTLLNYRATETQAIGRVRRFGQTRTVHIHRLLALDTIDFTIYNSRVQELRAKPDHVEIPRGDYVPKTKPKK